MLTAWLIIALSTGLPASPPAPELQLAHELAEEGDWDACLLECQRVAAQCPAHKHAAERLAATAEATRSTSGNRPSWWRRIGALPVRAMVAFYRSTVAPALGSRCVLHPSCSAYSLQAAKERGWLGIPMTADRLIREPTVVNTKAHPVGRRDGRTYYADPISDHIGGKR